MAGVREAYKTIMENAKAYKADANIHGIADPGNGSLGNGSDYGLGQ